MQITIDEKLKLLAGFPLEVETFGLIYPLRLGEIIEYGYQNYLQRLNLMCLKKEDLLKGIDLPEEITDLEVLLILSDEFVKDSLKESLEFFFKAPVTLYPDKGVIAVGDENTEIRVITNKNFDDIRYVLQLQNYLISVEGADRLQLKDEKAKAVAERMKKAKEEVERIKKKESDGENDSDFFDLLSSISSKSNSINKFQLLDLTIFQIYEEFKRINAIDQYETGIMAMLQGAKGVKLKHWSSTIKI